MVGEHRPVHPHLVELVSDVGPHLGGRQQGQVAGQRHPLATRVEGAECQQESSFPVRHEAG